MLDNIFFSDKKLGNKFNELKNKFKDLKIDMEMGSFYNEFIGITLDEDKNYRTDTFEVEEEFFIGFYHDYEDDMVCSWGYEIRDYISEYDFSGTEGDTSMIVYDGKLLFNRLKYIQGLMGDLSMLNRVPDELLKDLCDFVKEYWPLSKKDVDTMKNDYSIRFLEDVLKRSLMFPKEDNEWPREIFHINPGLNKRYFVRGVKVPEGYKYDLEAEYSYAGGYGYYTEKILSFNKEYTLKDLVDIAKGSNDGWASKMDKVIKHIIQAIADNKYKEPTYNDSQTSVEKMSPEQLEKIKILQEHIAGRIKEEFPSEDDWKEVMTFDREKFNKIQPGLTTLHYTVIKLEPKEEE